MPLEHAVPTVRVQTCISLRGRGCCQNLVVWCRIIGQNGGSRVAGLKSQPYAPSCSGRQGSQLRYLGIVDYSRSLVPSDILDIKPLLRRVCLLPVGNMVPAFSCLHLSFGCCSVRRA